MNPSDELVLRAFNQAPLVIQESLSDGKAVDFMESMLGRYNLHVDTTGYAMGFIRDMLLGLLKPEQFIGKLNSIGIIDEVAKRITSDLNKEVFIPLRDEMKKGGVGAQAQPPASIPHVPVMSVASPKPEKPIAQPTPTPSPVSEPPPFNLIRPEVAPTKQGVTTPPQSPQAPPPIMRTMQHDMNAVSHGMRPDPYPSALSMTPAREFQTASVPFTSVPVPSRPIEPVVSTPPSELPRTAPQAPRAQIQSSPTNSSSDPYRENI